MSLVYALKVTDFADNEKFMPFGFALIHFPITIEASFGDCPSNSLVISMALFQKKKKALRIKMFKHQPRLEHNSAFF